MKKLLFLLTVALLLLNTGCGTLFFYDRMGKKMSKVIDRRVFTGNCLLGLFGIVPGVVAFILDYNSETIYYTEAELLPDDFMDQTSSLQMQSIPCKGMNEEEIARRLSLALGKEISSDQLKLALKR